MIVGLLLLPLAGVLMVVGVFMSTMVAFLVVLSSALGMYMTVLMSLVTAFMFIMFS